MITRGFIGSEAKGRTTTLGRGGSDYTAALLGEALHATRVDIWTDVPGIYTTDPRVVSAAKRIDVIAFEEAAEMATFGAKCCIRQRCCPQCAAIFRSSLAPVKIQKRAGRWSARKPRTRHCSARWPCAAARRWSRCTATICCTPAASAEVFGILARHNISVDLITTSEVSIALTLDTTGSTSTGDTLLTQSLLIELSELCRVEVEEDRRWWPSSVTSCLAPAAWAKRCSACLTRSTSA